jgi:hypothetical protein
MSAQHDSLPPCERRGGVGRLRRSPAPVSAAAPTVIQIYEPDSVNTIPFVGRGGARVATRFVGRCAPR